jgi:PAS domain S-box-containing protein
MALAVLVEERKDAEQALRQREVELKEAQRLAKVGSWQWDPETDAVTWSEELYRIAGLDFGLPAITYAQHSKLYTPESWLRLRSAVEESLRTGTPYELDLEMNHADGRGRLVVAKGEVQRDGTGRIVQLRGTVQDITGRKQAQDELRQSEERLRLAIQAGKMYACHWDAATDVFTHSPESAQILGTDQTSPLTHRQVLDSVHPEDREKFTAAAAELCPEKPAIKISYRMVRPDGTVIWLERNSRAHFDENGKLLRIIGIVADISERKRAEEALSSVNCRLIEAQEEERARIARELHDDLSQRMALLQIHLEQFQQDTTGLSSKARQQLHDIAEVSIEVSSSIHDLSHQLHPSKLDTLGLVVSLTGLCREFSEQHRLQVQFVHHDIPGKIPKDVTLCLFRIVQEALQNVVKHSGASEATVQLSVHDDRIELAICDSGVGFNPESAEGDASLGLISMRERLRLVGGHLGVESEPSRGTRIHVRVPFFTTNDGVANEGKAHKAGA